MRISCMTDHNSRQAAILQIHTYSAKIQNKVKPPTEQLSSDLPILAQAKLALKGRLPLWQSWSIIGSHLAAAVYREKYGELDRAKNARENSKATVGSFGVAPISDILYDSAIGVDDIDRTNGIHGAGLGDQRHIILLNKADDGRLEAAAVTSFGGARGEGKGKPPRGQEHHFGLLITELDQAPTGTCVIRYSEVPLTKPGSYGSGSIKSSSFPRGLLFEVGHRLRVEGARRKREWNAKVASCGYDATKLEERRIRQERAMKQKQQEAQLAASERAQRAKKLHEQQYREFERRSAGTGSQAVRDPAIEDDVAESSQVEGLST
ncbi:hypothetical protein KC354_g2611 [Hortaea werneckii]|nr:hypothetical protein KC354_g2611 [Hortaea werneckii]